MNKKVIIIGVVLLLLIGGFWFFNNKSSDVSSSDSDTFDIFAQNMSVTCTYKDDEGRSATTYVKNGAVRSDYTGATDENSGSVILKDKTMYTWSGTEGYMMKLSDISVTPPADDVIESSEPGTTEEKAFVEEIKKYKDSCKQTALDDALFVVPQDVTFMDYSEMMEENAQMMEDYSGMSEEEMMKYVETITPGQ